MNRWLALISRIGTAIASIGLALLLISLIPAGSSGANSQTNTGLQANTFTTIFGQVMSPQQSATLTVTSDLSVDVYIVEVSDVFLYGWINSHYGMNPKYSFSTVNVTYLREFLGNYSQSITYSQTGTLAFNYQYTPTKITNVTMIVSNPSSYTVSIQSSWTLSQQVAPASRVATLAYWSMPIGLVLAMPWFVDFYQRRVGKQDSGTNPPV